jgi:sec-independent protein translocase protein TatA
MGSDLAIVLVVVLVIVLIWRGPKTLPLLGRAFGQGVKEARKEIEGVKDDGTATATPADTDEAKPPQP